MAQPSTKVSIESDGIGVRHLNQGGSKRTREGRIPKKQRENHPTTSQTHLSPLPPSIWSSDRHLHHCVPVQLVLVCQLHAVETSWPLKIQSWLPIESRPQEWPSMERWKQLWSDQLAQELLWMIRLTTRWVGYSAVFRESDGLGRRQEGTVEGDKHCPSTFKHSLDPLPFHSSHCFYRLNKWKSRTRPDPPSLWFMSVQTLVVSLPALQPLPSVLPSVLEGRFVLLPQSKPMSPVTSLKRPAPTA